jgi:hypothetical protein
MGSNFWTTNTHVIDSEVSEKMRRWFRIRDAALGASACLGDLVFRLADSTRRWGIPPLAGVAFRTGRDPAS